MNISYKWLKELLDFNLSVNNVSDLLTDIGLEVEKVNDYEFPSTDLSKLLIGLVKESKKHPNADRLKVTKVDVGGNEDLTIVCGAPNVSEGQKVVVAPVGTNLITSTNESFKINKSKIRGIESEGMLCAEDEIGVGDSHDGIIVLNKKYKIGDPVSKVYKKYQDKIFEIALTPNRCDAISHYGVARDLSAALSYRNDKKYELILPSVLNYSNLKLSPGVIVDIKDSSLCNRFCGLVIKGIKIKPSSEEIKNKLISIGLKPINNVVDITNLVMHELGQPLHAYDLDKIKSGRIEIKTLKDKTVFKTLDEQEIKLSKNDLVICDGDIPMCLAGVYGGYEYSVNNQTKTIFLESAYFNPISVRKTSKNHSINTDSSYRFERGVDIEMVDYALKRAASLIKDSCDGEIICDIIDEYPSKIEEKNIVLNFEKINSLIGYEIDKLKIKSILNFLDFKINNVTDISVGIEIPKYRHDVNRECDVVEEILRIHGYNNIPNDETLKFSLSTINNDNNKFQNLISNYLSSISFNEIMNNSLVQNEPDSSSSEIVKLKNSISNDISIMRTNLLDGFLKCISYNINRKSVKNNFYEFGSVYGYKLNSYTESKRLGIAINGDIVEKSWSNKSFPAQIFYLKNVVLNILELFKISYSEHLNNDRLTLKNGDSTIAEIRSVSSDKLKDFGIKSNVFFALIDIDLLFSKIKPNFFNVKSVSKYPKVVRDFSFLVEDDVLFSKMKNTILSIDPNIIGDIKLGDSYRPDKSNGKKSYSFSVTINPYEGTLSDKQIKRISDKIIKSVSKEFNAVLRDQ